MNIFSIKKIEYIALVAILLCGFISITYADICDGDCPEAPSWNNLGFYQKLYPLSFEPPCNMLINYKARYNPCTGKCEAKIEIVAISPEGCTDLTPKQIMDWAGKVIFENWPPIPQVGQQNYDPWIDSSVCSVPAIDSSAQYTLFYAQCVRWADSTVAWNSGPEIPENAAYLIPCGDDVGCCHQIIFLHNIHGHLVAVPDFPTPIGGPQCVTQYQPCFYICTEP